VDGGDDVGVEGTDDAGDDGAVDVGVDVGVRVGVPDGVDFAVARPSNVLDILINNEVIQVFLSSSSVERSV